MYLLSEGVALRAEGMSSHSNAPPFMDKVYGQRCAQHGFDPFMDEQRQDLSVCACTLDCVVVCYAQDIKFSPVCSFGGFQRLGNGFREIGLTYILCGRINIETFPLNRLERLPLNSPVPIDPIQSPLKRTP